jgi:FeS assembly SUF system protein
MRLPVIPEPSATPPAPASESKPPLVKDPVKTLELTPAIVDALSTVYDPEIPVNIYELGLVYDIIVDASAEAEIRMTLTAPACPAAQTLPIEVQNKVKAIPGIADARVEIVWEPQWTKDRMSDTAKLQLGIW